MPDYTFCKNSSCSQLQQCKRYMIRESYNPVEIDFWQICNNKNNYFLKIQMDKIEKDIELIPEKESDT